MTGQRIWVMKMRFELGSEPDLQVRLKTILMHLSSNDIIMISTNLEPDSRGQRYLLKSINKKKLALEVIPLEALFNSSDFVEEPILQLPIQMISDITVLPKEDILFLINQIENPHIYNAISRL